MNLPFTNACLNFISASLLIIGFIAIKKKRQSLHKKLMFSALISSGLFLSSYLYYHFTQGHIKFLGKGLIKFIYLIILIPHILLAGIMLPLIFRTFYLALTNQIEKHRRLAKWTFSIWLYVSITGILLYIYIYILFPI